MKRKFRYRRTSEIKMTNEARVLRRLRLDSGKTIKETAQAIGKSDWMISVELLPSKVAVIESGKVRETGGRGY